MQTANEEFEDIESEPSYEEWIFEISSEINNLNNEEQILHENVMTHFSHYRQSMIDNSNPNTSIRRLEVGIIVLLKTDFDNNSAKKWNPFDSFFENERVEIISILENNMVKIQNMETQEILIVYGNRQKKVRN